MLKNKSREDGNFPYIDFLSANYSHLLQLTCLMTLMGYRLLQVAYPDKEKSLLGGEYVKPPPTSAQLQLVALTRRGPGSSRQSLVKGSLEGIPYQVGVLLPHVHGLL